ncbi:adenosylcobinamide-GDP ribazoletransferase [Neptuniibacter halophilus]|uniref:adenosylcobinamide-GDP ribazoletransferase n=1 Tax=Neptuniibacter halophilus TaxID=651666 RepID=UPI0025724B5E|nr:adenosylcobinamide-GDP ribazoletransferase [Neptuniibacter halophilus]
MKSYPQQLHLFFNALSFFSRIPVPGWVDFRPDNQARALPYLPWVGLLIGVLSALVFWLCESILPTSVALLLTIGAGILLTGGLHEDGLADCCDGFGGGWQRDKILQIMKDSQVGTFGVIGLVLVLLTKYEALLQLEQIIPALILGHTLSRLAPLLLVYRESYVGLEQSSKSSALLTPPTRTQLLFAALPVLLCLLFLPASYLSLIPLCLLITLCMARYFRRWIGGYTGDCLGCCQQLCELAIYLWLCLSWF